MSKMERQLVFYGAGYYAQNNLARLKNESREAGRVSVSVKADYPIKNKLRSK